MIVYDPYVAVLVIKLLLPTGDYLHRSQYIDKGMLSYQYCLEYRRQILNRMEGVVFEDIRCFHPASGR